MGGSPHAALGEHKARCAPFRRHRSARPIDCITALRQPFLISPHPANCDGAWVEAVLRTFAPLVWPPQRRRYPHPGRQLRPGEPKLSTFRSEHLPNVGG